MAKTTPAVTADSRTYFLTYLIPASFTDSEANSIKEAVASLVTKHKGSIARTENWEKRRMAYKIKHSGKWQTEAHYVHLTIMLEPTQIQALERDVYLNQSVMRHLLVLTGEAGIVEAQS